MAFLKSLLGSFKKKRVDDVTESEGYGTETAKKRVVLFLIPSKLYQAELSDITKNLASQFNRILYVSLNKPAEVLKDILNESSIDVEKFLFVDAVNKEVKQTVAFHNVVMLNSPQNFEKFNIGLNEILEKENFDCLIFDSLSTMLIYQDEVAVIRFVHDLITKLRIANKSIDFISLSEDSNSPLVKDTSMFADKIIDISKNGISIKNADTKKLDDVLKMKNELKAIEEAYASKLISDESYLRTKERISQKLNKLRK